MALFIPGKSLCSICQNPIAEQVDVRSFPPFLPLDHRLARYSDSTVHECCLARLPERDELVGLLLRYRAIWQSCPEGLTLAQAEQWGKDAFKEFFDGCQGS
jgi:hypothetical protein